MFLDSSCVVQLSHDSIRNFIYDLSVSQVFDFDCVALKGTFALMSVIKDILENNFLIKKKRRAQQFRGLEPC